MSEQPRWLSTGYFASKPSEVDREKGIITGALVVTEGEASGHGVWLESEFVDEVVSQGNASKSGLKARFGHPNMCSTALGTFLGRWKNFRRDTVTRNDGSKAGAARADLFLSASAKETPNGDLHKYVLDMAEKEKDMFGTSIVFTPGDDYRRTKSGKKVHRVWQVGPDGKAVFGSDGYRLFRWVDEKGKDHDPSEDPIVDRDYAVCEKLQACDAVDDPAANDGMFSRFAQETVAGQITEFLDLHPQVWQAVETNPEVLAALANYGDRIDEFIDRYRTYREHNQGDQAMSNEAEAGVTAPEETPETVADQELELAPEGAVETGATETAPEGDAEPETPPEGMDATPTPPAPETATIPDSEPAELSRDEFLRIVDRFGAEVAAATVKDGGDYASAMQLHLEALEAENAALRAQVAESSAGKAGQPVPVRQDTSKPPLFKNVK
jgi:hypothetical protein